MNKILLRFQIPIWLLLFASMIQGIGEQSFLQAIACGSGAWILGLTMVVNADYKRS